MYQKVLCSIIAIILLSSCSHAPKKQVKKEPSVNLPCLGSYEASVQLLTHPGKPGESKPDISPEGYQITLKGINPPHLNKYFEVKPNTGGRRIFVYFDIDDDPAAEYCLFVYQDEWTLRKETMPGFFGENRMEGRNLQNGNMTSIFLKKEWIPEPVKKMWNFEMK